MKFRMADLSDELTCNSPLKSHCGHRSAYSCYKGCVVECFEFLAIHFGWDNETSGNYSKRAFARAVSMLRNQFVYIASMTILAASRMKSCLQMDFEES